jgi:hypothetical protein
VAVRRDGGRGGGVIFVWVLCRRREVEVTGVEWGWEEEERRDEWPCGVGSCTRWGWK